MPSAQTLVEAATLERIRTSELEEARSIQQAMLPVEPLHGPTVKIVSRVRPVTEVGGDFLDFFWLDDKRVGLYMGDVVGKGLPAAMYAALAVGALRGMHKTGTPPNAVLEVLNNRLRMRVVPGRYCSVQYALFDPHTNELWHSNAGLPRPLHISPRDCREVGGGGLPSGLFEGATYDQHSVKLSPGDSVLFSSDGVFDARNPDGEDFGIERLMEVCAANATQPAEKLIDAVFHAVDKFAGGNHQQDDMTVAVLRLAE